MFFKNFLKITFLSGSNKFMWEKQIHALCGKCNFNSASSFLPEA